MFGGIAFMLAGNMCCGVIGEDLMVRLGPDEGPKALGEEGVRPMDFTGRADEDRGLRLARGHGGRTPGSPAGSRRERAFASSLPPKKKPRGSAKAKA